MLSNTRLPARGLDTGPGLFRRVGMGADRGGVQLGERDAIGEVAAAAAQGALVEEVLRCATVLLASDQVIDVVGACPLVPRT